MTKFKPFDKEITWEDYNDLDQRVLDTWAIIDDLKLIQKEAKVEDKDKLVDNLIEIYQFKFDVLYNELREKLLGVN